METSNRVFSPWFLAIAVYACFCSMIRERIAVESSHVVYETLQGSSPSSVDPTLRTGYHFRPPRNWINDPNGPLYYKDFYHLFYQYNPYGSVWGNIVWGHSISTDLINWKALTPAIYPSKPFDIFGCWSGSATILPGDKPAILYTGIDTQKRQVQNIAFPANLSDPYLREWVKPDYNPVMPPETGLNSSSFRDPTTAWYNPNGHWTLIIGNKRDADNRGMALLYRSKDFVKWVRAKHPLHSAKNSGMWECPDFYPVALRGKLGLDTSVIGAGVKHVLKMSLDLTRYDYYTLGKYDDNLDKYVPQNTSLDNHSGLRYDYGNFYASKTFYDPVKLRRILWGWANESDTPKVDSDKGWAGIQLIPRTIWLHRNGRQLLQWPIEEFDTLRHKHVSVANKLAPAGGLFEVKDIQSNQADVEITFDIPNLDKAEDFDRSYIGNAQAFCGKNTAETKGGVGPFGLYVLASSDLEERTAVFFKIFKNGNKHVVLMCNDPTRSTKREDIYKPTFAGFVDVDLSKAKRISLRTLIDNSVVESFGARGKTCITSRVYPAVAIGKDAHLFVFNNGAEDVKVSELNAWEIRKPEMNQEIIY
ncbi:beta-fructofuranosidase, insoluble isoenzyme 3 [Canna indica]|uniref:Beta-fructofuranosidase, insoluble isoenzyme 3 n=1 Tax=Canna indica TaxID=4628 RepID=A0AAQ3Q7U7_9LILI|nr:beta-fructofuranosidase, insoluble isoenzyme 3 [Canna indica]